MKPVLIFDLDGTLVDSKKDLTASVNYIRYRFDLPSLTEDEIARLGQRIGLKLHETMLVHSGKRNPGADFDLWEATGALYRTYARTYEGGSLQVAKLGPKDYFEVYLFRDGKIFAPCGTFVAKSGTETAVRVSLNAPYEVHPGDTWVVTQHAWDAAGTGRIVLRPANA